MGRAELTCSPPHARLPRGPATPLSGPSFSSRRCPRGPARQPGPARTPGLGGTHAPLPALGCLQPWSSERVGGLSGGERSTFHRPWPAMQAPKPQPACRMPPLHPSVPPEEPLLKLTCSGAGVRSPRRVTEPPRRQAGCGLGSPPPRTHPGLPEGLAPVPSRGPPCPGDPSPALTCGEQQPLPLRISNARAPAGGRLGPRHPGSRALPVFAGPAVPGEI